MTADPAHSHTWSICPVCMKRIPAQRIRRINEIFLRKTCPAHGTFESLIWRGFSDFDAWISGTNEAPEVEPPCPDECGLCADHQQDTCCVILNITNRCNLDCRFCLADSTPEQGDPDFEQVQKSLVQLVEKGKTLVQLSGGEPTVRDDLPQIIRAAKEAGAKYVQLNSNGIRLGEDRRFVHELATAGLSFVFMQFDGTNDDIYLRIRNKELLDVKQKAIEHCAEFNIGVALVPTLVKGINTQHIGEIIQFGMNLSPNVRGIHFQPVTYLGRTPGYPSDHDRFTLDELIHEINIQTDGMIHPENLIPSACDHPLCGFHGDFVVFQNQLFPLLNMDNSKKCCCHNRSSAVDKNREFVARRWQRPSNTEQGGPPDSRDLREMEFFLERVKTHGFTLTAMAFQDAGNMDLTRLQQCSLHVFDQGRMVPFCSYYLTPWKAK